jgi:hypothetical protein
MVLLDSARVSAARLCPPQVTTYVSRAYAGARVGSCKAEREHGKLQYVIARSLRVPVPLASPVLGSSLDLNFRPGLRDVAPSTSVPYDRGGTHMMTKMARSCFLFLVLAVSGVAVADRAAPLDDDATGMCLLQEDVAAEAPSFQSNCAQICGPCEDAGGVCVRFQGHCSCG